MSSSMLKACNSGGRSLKASVDLVSAVCYILFVCAVFFYFLYLSLGVSNMLLNQFVYDTIFVLVMNLYGLYECRATRM